MVRKEATMKARRKETHKIIKMEEEKKMGKVKSDTTAKTRETKSMF